MRTLGANNLDRYRLCPAGKVRDLGHEPTELRASTGQTSGSRSRTFVDHYPHRRGHTLIRIEIFLIQSSTLNLRIGYLKQLFSRIAQITCELSTFRQGGLPVQFFVARSFKLGPSRRRPRRCFTLQHLIYAKPAFILLASTTAPIPSGTNTAQRETNYRLLLLFL